MSRLEHAFEQLEARLALTVATGPEALVNTWTAGTQQFSGATPIARAPDGSMVAVWESYNEDSLLSWGVYGRRLDATGQAQGSPFLVSSVLLNDQRAPSVAADGSGNFVVCWEGRGLLGALFPGIYVQRFDAAGNAVGGNIGVVGSLALSVSNSAIATAADGSFMVVWEDASIAGRDISARRYAANGTALGAAFVVNQTTAGNQVAPRVSVDENGNFLVAWSGNGAGDASGVFCRMYDSSGAAVTAETLVNTGTSGTQAEVAIAAAPGGGFRAAWAGEGSGDVDGVYARAISPGGVPTGSAVLVNQTTGGVQSGPSIAVDTDGEFLVGWSGAGSGDSDGAFVREFWSDLSPKGGEMSAASTSAGTQQAGGVAAGDDNSYFVVFSGNGTGDGGGTFLRTFENAPPVVQTSIGSLAYAEGMGAVAVDGGLLVSDADSAMLAGAEVRISAGYLAGEDALAYTDQWGLSASWDSATGVLTLTGTASIASYQAALRSIGYVNASDTPSTAGRTVSFRVRDALVWSSAATRGIAVSAVNDAPTVTPSRAGATYTENGAAVVLDPLVGLGDVDSSTLAGATVRISGQYVNGEDVLQGVSGSGIAVSWNAATGTLTLSGVASVAAYRQALRAISYANLSDNPSSATRTIEVIASDGSDSSTPVSYTMAVVPVNDAPTITPSGAGGTYTENGAAVVLDPLLVLGDVDSSTLAGATIRISGQYVNGEDVLQGGSGFGITVSWNPATGTLTLSGVASVAAYQSALRSIAYMNLSDNPSPATRTIEIVVSDGSDSSSPVSYAMAVVPVNDAPTITPSGAGGTYTENGAAVVLDPLVALGDVDSSTLTGATIRISSGYQTTQDVLAFVSQPGITGSWDAATGTLALSGVASLGAYRLVLRSISYANLSDNPSSAARTIEIVVSDGSDNSSPVSYTMAVVPVNDAPTITRSGTGGTFTENGAGVVIDPLLVTGDVDSATLAGATIRVSGGYQSGQDVLGFVAQPGITGSWDAATGTLTLSGTASLAVYQLVLRSISYTNLSDDPSTTTRTIDISVNDGSDDSVAVSYAMAIVSVNDAPTITPSSAGGTYTENGAAVVLDPLVGLGDVDSSTLVGATIRISGQYVNGEDVLQGVAGFGIAVSWNAATGTLTLSGIATVAAYQQVLRSISYVNLSDNPSSATRTIEIVVSDGSDNSSPVSYAMAVVPVNDAPTIVLSGTPLMYMENAGPLALANGLTLGDPDSSMLAGATIRISSGYQSAQDVLDFVPQFGITGSWDGAVGVLTLTGSASVAAYQLVLRTLSYWNSSDAPSATPRVISIEVTDGTDWSGAATRGVSVVAVNDPPSVTCTPGQTVYQERSGPRVVDAGLVVADVDSATLSGAIVRVASNYANGEDVLGFVNQLGISGAWDPVTGTLTLSGIATVAAYQQALRTVTFENASHAPSTPARQIEFIVTDGTDQSVAAARGLVVDPIDDPPIVALGSGPLTYVEGDGFLLLATSATVTDADSSVLTGAVIRVDTGFAAGEDVLEITPRPGIAISWDAAAGILTLAGTASVADYMATLRTLTFRNPSDAPTAGVRQVSVAVTDGTSTSLPATVSVDVVPSNDAPSVQFSLSALIYTEGSGAVQLDGGMSVTDVDSGQLAGATVTVAAGYAPGEDVLSVSPQAGISVSWDAMTGVLTLSGAASVAAYEATLRSLRFINSSDAPSAQDRSIVVVVDDGSATSMPVGLTVTVAPVDDPPVVTSTPGTAAYIEGAPPLPLDAGLVVQDVDSATLQGATIVLAAGYAPGEDVLVFVDQLGISGTWDPATGTLALSGSASVADYQTALRSVRYQNTSDVPSVAARVASFMVTDGTLWSAPAGRSLSVQAVNDRPVVTVSGTPLTYVEGSGYVAIDAGLLIGDPDSATLSGAMISIGGNYALGQDTLWFVDQFGITGSWNAALGELTLTGTASVAAYQQALRTVTFRNGSAAPSMLTRTIRFVVSDGTDASDPAFRDIAVSPVNDAPVVQIASGTVAYAEQGAPALLDGAMTVQDADSATLTSAAVRIVAGYRQGVDVLSFDGQGVLTASWDAATGTLWISGVAPLLTYQAALRSVRFEAVGTNPGAGTRTIAVAVSDGQAASAAVTRDVVVVLQNDPPEVQTSGGSATFREGAGAVLVDPGVLVLDVDSGTMAAAMVRISGGFVVGEDLLTAVTAPGMTSSWDSATGTLTLAGAASLLTYRMVLRSVRYQNLSSAPSSHARTIAFVVSDGALASLPAWRLVDVVPVNDAPVVACSGGSAAFIEGGLPVAIDPAIAVVDVDSQLLQGADVTIASGFEPGTDVLTLAAPGMVVVWDPQAGTLSIRGSASAAQYQSMLRGVSFFSSSHAFGTTSKLVAFRVFDGEAWSADASRQLRLTPVDDAPAVNADTTPLRFVEGQGPMPLDPRLGVADVDSPTLAWARIAIGGHVPGEDVLSVDAQPGISADWNQADGVLLLSGLASPGAYQAALRSIRFVNTSAAPSQGPRTVEVVVFDGELESTPVEWSLSVVSVNSAPVLSVPAGVRTYIENEPFVGPLAGLTIADVDSPMLAGASIQITANYRTGEDLLACDAPAGITVSWDASLGMLHLSGLASRGVYQAALRSLRYSNTSDDPSAAMRTVTVTAADAEGASASANVLVQVVPVNDGPTLTIAPGQLNAVAGVPSPLPLSTSVFDPDSPLAAGASVRISAGYVPGSDRLEVPFDPAVQTTFDSDTGTLTLRGSLSWSDLRSLLEQLRFVTGATDGGVRTFSIRVSDGASDSNECVASADVVSAEPPDDGTDGPDPGPLPPDDPVDTPPIPPDPPVPRTDPPNGGLPPSDAGETPDNPSAPVDPAPEPTPPHIEPDFRPTTPPESSTPGTPPRVEPEKQGSATPVPEAGRPATEPQNPPVQPPSPPENPRMGEQPTPDRPAERVTPSPSGPATRATAGTSVTTSAAPQAAGAGVATPRFSTQTIVVSAAPTMTVLPGLAGTPFTRSVIVVSASFAGLLTASYVVWAAGGVWLARRSSRALQELWTPDLVLLIRTFDARATRVSEHR